MSGPAKTAAEEAANKLSEQSLALLQQAVEGNFKPALTVATGLFVIALLAHLIVSLARVQRGEPAGYGNAIATIAIHILLLSQYTAFSSTVLSIGGALTKGGSINGTAEVEKAAVALTKRFNQAITDAKLRTAQGRLSEQLGSAQTEEQRGVIQETHKAVVDSFASGLSRADDATGGTASNVVQLFRDIADSPLLPSSPSLLTSSPTEIVNKAIEAIAEFFMTLAFIVTSAVVLLLSMIQKTAITLILAVGPIIIVLSAFPGPTSGLLYSWAMTLFEVQLWAFAVRVLNSMMGARFDSIPTSIVNDKSTVMANLAGFAENIAYCFILSAAYLTIPILCGALLRGGGMGSVAGQVMGQATGFASGVLSGRLGGASGFGGGKSGGGARSGGGGGGAGPSGGPAASTPAPTSRAGDEGVATRSMTKGEAIAKQRAIQNNMNRAE